MNERTYRDAANDRGARSHLALAVAAAATSALVAGCSFDRADPAARSNRAMYTITVNAHGDNSTATAYIRDGLMATADGEGTITQPTSMTTEQSPDLTMPGDAMSAVVSGVAHLGGKAIDAYAAKNGAKTDAGSTGQGQTSEGCVGGNCDKATATADCPDGTCTKGE